MANSCNNILLYLFISLLILLFALLYTFSESNNVFSENYRKQDKDDTIFVSVASYRDDDCKNTLNHIFKNADNPDNVFVGVLSQYKNKEESCECRTHKHAYNIRYINVDETQAAGPLYARIKIINQLYAGEKYFLMIDAHTRFKKGWDTIAKAQLTFLNMKGVEKPVISAYPATFKDYKNKPNRKDVPFICEIKGGDKIPKKLNAIFMSGNKFRKGYFIGAGCMFTYGSFIETIELSPHLKHIFGGEELLFSILAYTHGWDIYGFAENFVFHHYGHGKPNWAKDNAKKVDFTNDKHKSYKFLEDLLTNPDAKHSYKLGTKRSLQSFWDIIGWQNKGNDFSKNWNKDNNKVLCNNTQVIEYR